MSFNYVKIAKGVNLEPLGQEGNEEKGDLRCDNVTSNLLYHNGTSNQPLLTDTNTATVTNKSINADNNTITNIDNNDIKAAAAIDATKIANGTVSNTEFQFLDGVTSAIQTQLDGKVTGPGSATDNAITRFDGTTGKLVQNSAVIVSDANGVSGVTVLDVDNVNIDGNTITTTNTNGNLILDANGTGSIQIDSLRLSNATISSVGNPVNITPAAGNNVVMTVSASGAVQVVGGPMTLPEISTPPTPTSGSGNVYFKTDGFLYQQNDGGTETKLLSSANLNVTSKTANYTATSADDVILCNASGGSFTITLPAAASNTGKVLRIKKTDSTLTGTVTIDGNASETIDGALTRVLVTPNETIMIVCDGSNWDILSREQNYSGSYTPAITGSVSNPTKGTTTTDIAYFYREGRYIDIVYYYVQTVAGSDGSGFYRYALPSNIAPDTTLQPIGTNSIKEVTIGSVAVQASTTVYQGSATMISSTLFGLVIGNETQTFDFTGTIAATRLGTATINYTAHFRFAVAGWDS